MSAEILVVDDDTGMRQLLRHRLEREGYRVQTAPDGKSATDVLNHDDPDLGIFDVMMPRVDGKQLLQRVRRDELAVSPEFPVVILSSKGRKEHLVEGFEYGADDYVTKPFEGDDLLTRVDCQLRG